MLKKLRSCVLTEIMGHPDPLPLISLYFPVYPLLSHFVKKIKNRLGVCRTKIKATVCEIFLVEIIYFI